MIWFKIVDFKDFFPKLFHDFFAKLILYVDISGTLGRRKDKLAKLQAEELKNTIVKNDNLEKELKEVKKELEKVKVSYEHQVEQNL